MSVYDRLRSAVTGESPEFQYECQSCHSIFRVEYYTCPECNSFSVERAVA